MDGGDLMSLASKLTFTREEKNSMIEKIQRFFGQERDEVIGIIAAEAVLDFFLETLGKDIRNHTLEEAKYWFSKRIEDLEGDFETLYK